MRAEMKSLSHWNDTKFAKSSKKGEMTMWDMAMTVRDLPKGGM